MEWDQKSVQITEMVILLVIFNNFTDSNLLFFHFLIKKQCKKGKKKKVKFLNVHFSFYIKRIFF